MKNTNSVRHALTLFVILLVETEDEIFVDAEDTTPGAPTQATSEDASASKPDTLIVNEETRMTSADPDPIFHAYSVQPYQESENLAVVENIPRSEDTTGDISLAECNELEWDTCAMYDDNAVLVNEGIYSDEDYIYVVMTADEFK